MDKTDFEQYIDSLPKPDTNNNLETPPEQFDCDDIWKIVSENLRLVMDKVEYQSWFGDTYLETIKNGVKRRIKKGRKALTATTEYKLLRKKPTSKIR